jgi:hypothetical protein
MAVLHDCMHDVAPRTPVAGEYTQQMNPDGQSAASSHWCLVPPLGQVTAFGWQDSTTPLSELFEQHALLLVMHPPSPQATIPGSHAAPPSGASQTEASLPPSFPPSPPPSIALSGGPLPASTAPLLLLVLPPLLLLLLPLPLLPLPLLLPPELPLLAELSLTPASRGFELVPLQWSNAMGAATINGPITAIQTYFAVIDVLRSAGEPMRRSRSHTSGGRATCERPHSGHFHVTILS